MLVVETVARIRREHFVKGKTIKEIREACNGQTSGVNFGRRSASSGVKIACRITWKEAPATSQGDFACVAESASWKPAHEWSGGSVEMPRKVLPRRGEIGATKVPTFTMSNEQIADHCTQLSLTTSDIPPQLKTTLEWIAARYRLWVQQDEKGPSQAERNAALKQVLASPQHVELTLAQLDSTTEGELLDVLWLRPGIKSGGSLRYKGAVSHRSVHRRRWGKTAA
jgi:hypothetical protein